MIYFTTVVDQYHHIFEAKVSVLYQKCSKLCICGLRHSQQGWIYLGGYPSIYQFFCLVLY